LQNMFKFVGWTIVTAFAATTIITLLAMTGIVPLVSDDHLDQLFAALILEIIAAGFFLFRWGTKQPVSPPAEQEYFEKASTLFKQALEQKSQKNLEEADRLLGEILSLPADNLPFEIRTVFRERGEIAFDRSLWQNAVDAYSVYYQIQPDDVDALVNYGRALRETNRYHEALRVYERAKKLSPNSYSVLNGLQNISRRMGGFFQEADREDAAERWFEETRSTINAMLKIAPDRSTHKKRYLNALLARARLYWQWERYPETIAGFRAIIEEFPERSDVREDLAAVLLEFGETRQNEEALEEARELYRDLWLESTEGKDRVFIGSGYAEAVAHSQRSSDDEVAIAEHAVLRSLTELDATEEDPYPFYAAALIFRRQNKLDQAVDYLKQAIRHERRRSSDPYRFDYRRLVRYEKLLQRWAEFGA